MENTNKDFILTDLSLPQLTEIRKILSRWSISRESSVGKFLKNEGNKKNNNANIKILFSILTSDMILEVKNKLPWLYNHPTLRHESISAATMVYFGLFVYRFSIDFYKSRNVKEETIKIKRLEHNLILLYLGSDFLLDDPDTPDSIKREMINCIDKKIKKSEDPKVQSILDILNEILIDEPESEEGIYEAWESEKLSEKQKKNDLSFDELWNISAYKGYKTISMANKILNNGIDLHSSEIIGSITQHIDDLMDHASDMKAGINTAATILMKKGKCLDLYLYNVLKEVDKLDKVPLMGILYTQVICNCAYRNKYTSEEMRELLFSFLIFDQYRDFENFVSSTIVPFLE